MGKLTKIQIEGGMQQNLYIKDVRLSDAALNVPTYDVTELVRDGKEAKLVLAEHTYNLRITRAGKLILTK